MNTKWIMIASASLLLVHGLALLFAPELAFRFFGLSNDPESSVIAQLLGAALIGFGLMNWTARGLVLGGIYGRALVYGNFAQALIGFLSAFRERLHGVGNEYFWIEIIFYFAFALGFGLVLFGGPGAKPKDA